MDWDTLRRNWRLPAVSFPSFMEELEDLMPTRSFLNGLSVYEDGKNVYVEAAVPGVDPKEVDVTFDKGILTIRAERKEEEKGKKYQRRATRSFFYRVAPSDVDLKKEPQASYKNGVMTITFTKIPTTKPKKIAVKTV